MALTLDGVLPAMGTASGMGSGVGLGAVGGGVAGLVLGSLLGSNGNGGLFGGNGNNNANVAEFGALNNQIQSLQSQIGSQGVHAEINELENSLNAANIANLQGINNNALLYQQGNANLSTAVATGNFTTLNSINGLGRDVVNAQNQSTLQQLNSFNNLTTTTLQGFNTNAMQIQNSTNQIISQGTANAAAVAAGFCGIAREMAECCCSIKGLVSAEAAKTNALINDLNVQNLRDQLAAANNKVSNNEQNQYLLGTILTHIHPTVTGTTIV
jgi:hypothetical protein